MRKQNKTPKIDELPSILDRGTLSLSNTVSLLKYLKFEDMDSDAVDEDLRTIFTRRKQEEISSDSNLLPFFQNDTVTAKNVLSHLNELPLFRFGFAPFYYWKYFERVNSYIRAPKYSKVSIKF